MTDAGATQALLDEREGTHGAFADQARTAQALKEAFRAAPNWRNRNLSDEQQEALEMIASKLARILSGDADHPDHWRDLAGYAELGLRTLEPPA